MSDLEKQWIKKAKQGDTESFERLIQGTQSKAYNIALRYLRNEDDAMDALQESFIKVFRSLGGFKEESSFDTWVYRIVMNTCHDQLRKNSRRQTEISLTNNDSNQEEITLDIPDMSNNPEMLLEKKEKLAFILSCVAKLPSDQREAFELRDIENFTYEEISEILQCSLGTVKSRISRARMALRQLIIDSKELNTR
jgi:RNA polymerase sigma-70 factor (ECF subfamily)